MIDIVDLVTGTGGEIISEKSRSFIGVGTDTRKDLGSQVFVALRGPNFDAHEFLLQAKSAGAAAMIIDNATKVSKEILDSVTIVKVDDTLKALQRLGNYWRRKNKAKILSITGSNGKTTTKEFTAAIVGAHRSTVFNKGSFNNHWGVPLSLLQIKPEHEVAVIEMGMNHLGEITELCQIAEPDAALVTNVGRVHLEGLGSIENVAKAKEEIYLSLKPESIRVFNLDNPFTLKMFEKYSSQSSKDRMITFSRENLRADITLRVHETGSEHLVLAGQIKGVSGDAKVTVFGEHNIYNLMGAAAMALAAGLKPQEIWSSLSLCQTPWGRNQKVHLRTGAEVIFDAYNANPESMAKMIENSLSLKHEGKKIAVIGEMLEMGTARDQVHQEVGKKIGQSLFDLVWFIGKPRDAFERGLAESGFKKEFWKSETFDGDLGKKLLSQLGGKDRIWIKGSRGMRLEQVVKALDPINFSDKKD